MGKRYSDHLPRKATGRCQALDDDGRRCRRRAAVEATFHGDNEQLFDETLSWVTVKLCKHHMTGYMTHKLAEKARL